MGHKRLRVLGVVAAALMLAVACGGSSGGGSTRTIKVGLVTDTGGLNDKSFNHLAYVGLQSAISKLGIKGDVIESKSGDEYVPNLTNFAQKGYDLVIGNGFLMQPAVGTVAAQFPNIHFAIVDGAGTDANFNDLKQTNVMDLFFKEQESGALVGAIAGLLEKGGKAPKNTHVISAVGGVKIPPVDHYLAGYQWAAKMYDPSIKVLIGYSNDFNATDKCKAVANSQIGQGSEFVFQVAGGCGVGALQAAGQAHVYSFGVDADQKDADQSVIASALKKVDVAVYDAIKSVVDGKFQGGATRFSLANDATGYTVDNFSLPADIKTEVDNLAAAMKSGSKTPPDVVS
ncbi:MAG TPA: BMP family ABC transporter substrate-binding protein [Candidatus Dormibacteraeota bacterium]|nr:BMP family ABC transporter substrate-binding protein [Candidatus Dormibacteraeota bacterium]